ncbi:MAG TPA: IclR family transcriptional regulator [Burkholderiales bacterium]|nr:IclR family transcriptional regulator [Burkholderiales bacterium]
MAQVLERAGVGEVGRTRKRTRLSSVANSLRLIKAFSEDRYEIGISELAKRLGLAKSTVHRLASTLLDQGMLEQNAGDGKYRLGLTLFELGALVRRKMDFTAEARPFLRTLLEKTGETVHLGILDHDSVLYVISLESKQALRMGSKVGTRVPVHATAVGKALLAFQTEEEVGRIVSRGLPASTPNTLVDGKALQRELALVRTRNYAIDDEESEVGLRSIAAPIRNDAGNVIAAISIAGPVHRMTKKTLLGWVRELVEAAEAISQRLGWTRSPGAARS